MENGAVKLPGKIGTVKAKIHRDIEGTIKTVTVSKDPSSKYYASILIELEGDNPQVSTDGKVVGVDLGLKHFAVISDGSKVSKFDNPKYLAKHEENLKRKQQKLATIVKNKFPSQGLETTLTMTKITQPTVLQQTALDLLEVSLICTQ